MAKNDAAIKNEINNLLAAGNSEEFIAFIDAVPVEKLRRVLYVFSEVFPDKLEISRKEFEIIAYVFSNKKFLEVESIADFIRAISIIHFDAAQKKEVSDLVLLTIHQLSRYCDFELNALIVNVFDPECFIDQMRGLLKGGIGNHLKLYLLNFISSESEFLQHCPQEKIDHLKQLLNDKGGN